MPTTGRESWKLESERVPGGSRKRIFAGGDALSFAGLLQGLRDDDAFCNWYSACLAEAEPEAYFWEHPPLSAELVERPAEFVLIEAPELSRLHPDPEPFRRHFRQRPGDVATFRNLGGDAVLVAPVPADAECAYVHLAQFVRHAPGEQVRNLWRCVSKAVQEALRERPVCWLSTSGLGVAWLHVRIDARPKYYQYRPYRSAT